MHANLVFTRPDDDAQFRLAVDAANIAVAIQEFDNWLRNRVKYGKASERRVAADTARKKLYEIFEERGILWVLEQ